MYRTFISERDVFSLCLLEYKWSYLGAIHSTLKVFLCFAQFFLITNWLIFYSLGVAYLYRALCVLQYEMSGDNIEVWTLKTSWQMMLCIIRILLESLESVATIGKCLCRTVQSIVQTILGDCQNQLQDSNTLKYHSHSIEYSAGACLA